MDRPSGSNRKRGGGDRRRSGGRPPHQRREPPPEVTGLEAAYLESILRAETCLVLSLADGREVRGKVSEFDRDQVTIEQKTGPIVVRKSEIRYLHEAD